MHETNILVSVQHELRSVAELRKAVLFARHQLLREASKLHYNVLLMEGYVSIIPTSLSFTLSLLQLNFRQLPKIRLLIVFLD